MQKPLLQDQSVATRNGHNRPGDTPTGMSITAKMLVSISVIIAALIVGVALWAPTAVLSDAVERAKTSNAETAQQLKILRSFYSSHVVAQLAKTNLLASPQAMQHVPGIPAPTTFILDVAKEYSDEHIKVGITSPYPWQTRRGRKTDDFQKQAWNYLTLHPNARFVRREIVGGREMLRVAVADRMEASCVACHNSNALSPKKDWKVGDVRGVIEVTTPIDIIKGDASRLSQRLIAGIALSGAILLLVLSFMSRRIARPLSQLTEVIHRVRAGLLDNAVPHLGRSDEIGAIAKALSALQMQTEERRKAELRISHMAQHDALTGLLNRTSFETITTEALGDDGRPAAMICLDLDRFKIVNDTYGHPVGDELLVQIAALLKEAVGRTGSVMRLGGDEFVILQSEGEQPNAATALAEQIIRMVGDCVDIGGQTISIGASVGIAIAPENGNDVETLLRNADMALYRAKGDGRGTFRFFETSMDELMRARRLREMALRRALGNGEFELHYQPLFALEEKRIVAFEALLRWSSPELGSVPPSDFIPLAEEIGLITPIGGWVLQTACHDAAQWPDDIRVSVNVSTLQFRGKRVLEQVVTALAQSGLAPARLDIEITESVMLDDSAAALETLHQLKNLGVRISMDDFGTGYSSLSYLQSFPFDKIKIDQSFIRNMEQVDSDKALAIIRAITSLGSGLGMCVTAEGVETVDQLRHAQHEGCTEVQGYFISKPVPVDQVSGLLDHDQSAYLAA